MKSVNVSLLEVRKKPSIPSKIGLNRDTVVKTSGPPIKYKDELWIRIETVNQPVVSGYVMQKYLKAI